MADDWEFPLQQFPLLPNGLARTVYVLGLPEDYRTELERRNYRVVELMTLPRESEYENQQYLLARLQAAEEGTIPASCEDRHRLELEARAWGLLDKKSTQMKIQLTAGKDELEKLLSWNPDRHTLSGNSTAVFAQLPTVRHRDE